MSRYDVRYLAVGGELWLRRTTHPPAVWFADFSGVPFVQREPYAGELPLRGSVGRASWDLTLDGDVRPFHYVPPLLRAVASTNVVIERPALRVGGRVTVDGIERALDGVPAQFAHVSGRRHAYRWGWFHAALPDGGWLDGLVAKAQALPQLAFHVRNGVRRWARGRAEPGTVRIGPFTVRADRADFVGVTYVDPGGAEVRCWHTELARLNGGGLEIEGVALEFGSRARVDGWTVSI
jgi:hypothetical protein